MFHKNKRGLHAISAVPSTSTTIAKGGFSSKILAAFVALSMIMVLAPASYASAADTPKEAKDCFSFSPSSVTVATGSSATVKVQLIHKTTKTSTNSTVTPFEIDSFLIFNASSGKIEPYISCAVSGNAAEGWTITFTGKAATATPINSFICAAQGPDSSGNVQRAYFTSSLTVSVIEGRLTTNRISVKAGSETVDLSTYLDPALSENEVLSCSFVSGDSVGTIEPGDHNGHGCCYFTPKEAGTAVVNFEIVDASDPVNITSIDYGTMQITVTDADEPVPDDPAPDNPEKPAPETPDKPKLEAPESGEGGNGGSDGDSGSSSSDSSDSPSSKHAYERTFSDGIHVWGNLTVSEPIVTTEQLNSGSAYDALRAAMGHGKLLGVFSVDMTDAGVPIHDGFGTLNITFPVDSRYDDYRVIVWHRHDNGNITRQTSVVRDGEVTIAVTDLSSFAIELDEYLGENAISPKTGQ